MSTQTMRGPTVRGYHLRNSLDLDLSNVPPSENRDQVETSQLGFQEAQINQQQSIQPAMIDIEAIDDDVIESSARASAEEEIEEEESDEDDEINEDIETDEDDVMKEGQSNTCQECGASFKKPAYLKQHMQSHSLERPYTCLVEGCHASYRRKDHLARHLLQHEGKIFKCPIESCSREFAYQSCIKRHLKEFHNNDAPSKVKCQQRFVCPENGCGKVFKFASKLQKHEDSHVKLESVETLCAEPGCMQYFTNYQCLRAHIQSCHQYMNCELCGSRQLRKNIKRHLRTHERESPQKMIHCTYEGCSNSFSSISNLRQHVKAVHLELKPFVCGFSGCGMRFAYKHVRDNHEKTGRHVYTCGDFEEADEQFRSRPKGGRKRIFPTVEMLVRKKVTPSNELDFMLDEEC